ncbi:MAG: GGDEF domain-containing protein [Oscillospiraceae bacterium]|nr:GGDEF domain-containing protein [Oscillospiraceae bacterium]
MDRRLNIGLMISHLEDDFAGAVCRGAIIGAREIDANLFIFPGRYIEGVYADKERTKYEYQYNTLFSYAFPEDIDVLLVLAGTIGSSLSYERKKEFLDSLGNIPIITLASEIEGYPSVCFDNKSGIRECIEHLITEHKCKKIGFVSGPETNGDAIERLSVYKETLEKHGIPVEEDRIVYGRFSPYSQETVEELLDRCPDLEAIAFANDAMVLGAYEVFEKRGIEVGRDILVTGFDDTPDAATLAPPLTTVNADASEIGYDAVIECQALKNGGSLKSRQVRSLMVKRRSCGCSKHSDTGNNTYSDIFVFNHCWCRSDEQAVSAMTKYLFDNYKTSSAVSEVKEEFTEYFRNIFKVLRSDGQGGIAITKEAKEYIPGGFEDLLTVKNMKYVDHDRLCTVIDYMSQRFSSGLESSDDKKAIALIFISMYQMLVKAGVTYCEKRVDDVNFLTWQSNSITKDMLLFDSYDDSSYGSVTDKLTRLNMKSSYIYVFQDTITHKNGQLWEPPAKVLLKSYHNGDVSEIIPTEDQELSIRHLFNHQYIPTDRQLTMVLSAIFLNEDHYGLFLSEIEDEYFYYVSSLAAQLCAAMKILRLIQDKEAIRLELEQTLAQIKEKNLQLDTVSKLDELTGVYNRRGFFAQANSVISSPVNEGKAAMVIFADLDSLKIINDTFGHEDGDFAIKSAAKILSDSFRSSDIIGRIGGDEFSVFAMVDGESTEDEIVNIVRSRIQKASDNLNKGHDKPYIVHMSVGVYAFNCGEDVELSKILAQADNYLYNQKKNKKSILRSEGALPLYEFSEAE